MDLFRSMQVFVLTVDAGSMTAAAEQLQLSSAMVGQYIAGLEKRLGTQLLQRTTRRQHLTDFGESYYEQCKEILERVALVDLAAQAQQSEARGKLRITAPTTFGATALVPVLEKYRQLSPQVQLDVVLTDRNIDLVEEGFDVAFRIGKLPDSRLIARPLMPYSMAICASPEYLATANAKLNNTKLDNGKPNNGKMPTHPSELSHYDAISFTPSQGNPWRFTHKDKPDEIVEVTPQSMITVNNGHALLNAARAGLGIVMQPRVLLENDIASGELVTLLPEWQLKERQLSLLYYRDQRMTPRVRSFITLTVNELGNGI